ncbi:MAG: hypothetical protein AAB405_02305 [Patescibacteria group bacterium]
MKKAISILIIILFIVAIGVGVYFGWQKSREILTPPSDINPQPIIDNQQQPPLTAPKPKLKIISVQSAFDYWTAVSGDVFYINQEGKIFKAKSGSELGSTTRVNEKEDELISNREINNLTSIKSNKDGTMVMVKYGDLSFPKLEIFDVNKKVWQLIGDNISVADFSPDSLKIIYVEKKGNGTSDLITKDLNSAKPKTIKIMSLSYLPYDLAWIGANNILLIPAPSAGYAGEIWQIDIKNKTIKSFASDFGLSIKLFSGSDNGLLFDSTKNQMSLVDANGAIKANIGISTLPEKCFMNASKIYCAIMQNYSNTLPKPILPDDYLKKAFYSRDKIYAIDIADNSSELVLSDELPPAIDAVNLSLNGNNLFFINRYDNRVYNLEL